MDQVTFGGLRRGSLAFALTVLCTMPVAAQQTPSGTTASGTTTSTSGTPTTTVRRVDDDRDWGWIGLLGLAGLAGLLRKNDRHDINRTTTGTTVR